MHAPLARHLTRFSRLPPPDATIAALEPAVEVEVREPTVTMTVAVFEARLQAERDEIRCALEDEQAVQRARVDAAHAEAMGAAVADAKAAREAQDGAAIAAQITVAREELLASVCESLAEALRPVLDEALTAKVVADLAEVVERVLADPDHPILTVRGPVSRLRAVEIALGGHDGVTFVATGEDEEITVAANGIRIETRLGPALAMLAGDA